MKFIHPIAAKYNLILFFSINMYVVYRKKYGYSNCALYSEKNSMAFSSASMNVIID